MLNHEDKTFRYYVVIGMLVMQILLKYGQNVEIRLLEYDDKIDLAVLS